MIAVVDDQRLFNMAPDRTVAQRKQALERGNRIRLARANLKRQVKAGIVDVPELILNPPDYVQTMKVADLLGAMRGYGPTKVNKLLVRTRLSPKKTLGGMTTRQRSELAVLVTR